MSVAEGSTITLPKVFLLKPVNLFFSFFPSFCKRNEAVVLGFAISTDSLHETKQKNVCRKLLLKVAFYFYRLAMNWSICRFLNLGLCVHVLSKLCEVHSICIQIK